jgi:hypothetical protein
MKKPRKAAEALRKKQEEANQKFLALLERGRGEKRTRRTFDGVDLEMHKQTGGGGLGFPIRGRRTCWWRPQFQAFFTS